MTRLTRSAFALPAVLLLALGGCLQTDYETTLYPDGSGKMTIRIAIRQPGLRRLRESRRPGDLPPEVNAILQQIQKPERIKEYFSGVVGWKPIKVEEDADWLRATYTVYFDDINQLQLQGDRALTGEKQLVFSWKLIQTPDGERTLYQITGLKGLPAFKIQPGDQAEAREMAKTMEPIFEDLRISLRVNVPGTIKDSKGVLEVDGRSASWRLDGALFRGALRNLEGSEMKRFRDIMDVPESRISWTGSDVTPAQLEAWKSELAAATNEWKGMSAAGLSDDELERSFIKAKLSAAQAHLDAGRKDQARKILNDIVREYPNHKETLNAKALLQKLGN
ncbi:MAG TPA: tetratricopeptide repeat protein [Planctomycetota bacterium]|nr:tetratricopeptide repeat protein [Planctomycetota bacterium]